MFSQSPITRFFKSAAKSSLSDKKMLKRRLSLIKVSPKLCDENQDSIVISSDEEETCETAKKRKFNVSVRPEASVAEISLQTSENATPSDSIKAVNDLIETPGIPDTDQAEQKPVGESKKQCDNTDLSLIEQKKAREIIQDEDSQISVHSDSSDKTIILQASLEDDLFCPESSPLSFVPIKSEIVEINGSQLHSFESDSWESHRGPNKSPQRSESNAEESVVSKSIQGIEKNAPETVQSSSIQSNCWESNQVTNRSLESIEINNTKSVESSNLQSIENDAPKSVQNRSLHSIENNASESNNGRSHHSIEKNAPESIKSRSPLNIENNSPESIESIKKYLQSIGTNGLDSVESIGLKSIEKNPSKTAKTKDVKGIVKNPSKAAKTKDVKSIVKNSSKSDKSRNLKSIKKSPSKPVKSRNLKTIEKNSSKPVKKRGLKSIEKNATDSSKRLQSIDSNATESVQSIEQNAPEPVQSSSLQSNAKNGPESVQSSSPQSHSKNGPESVQISSLQSNAKNGPESVQSNAKNGPESVQSSSLQSNAKNGPESVQSSSLQSNAKNGPESVQISSLQSNAKNGPESLKTGNVNLQRREESDVNYESIHSIEQSLQQSSTCSTSKSPTKVMKFSVTGKQLANAKTLGSPRPQRKHYSPITKKQVRTPNKLMSPQSTPRKLLTGKEGIPKKLFQDTEPSTGKSVEGKQPSPSTSFVSLNHFTLASEGQDDKTVFFLTDIYKYVENTKLKKLLAPEENLMLSNILTICDAAVRLLRKLYWRKDRWYKIDKLMQEEDGIGLETIENLVSFGYLIEGNASTMKIDEFVNVLSTEDIKSVCKFLKLKHSNKMTGVDALKEYSKGNKSILKFCGSSTQVDQSDRVVKLLYEQSGRCFRLSNKYRQAIYKLYLLSYLGMDFDIIRSKQLEHTLILLKIGKESFPSYSDDLIDDASVVFPTKFHFERYLTAHFAYEEFLECSTIEFLQRRISIVVNALQVYLRLPKETIEHYENIQPWLRRYTPVHVYLKILDEGIDALKRGSVSRTMDGQCIEILNILTEHSTFKTHKKGQWFDEKAKIYQKRLQNKDQAIKVLIEAIDSDIDDLQKDYLRKRAEMLFRHASDSAEAQKLKNFINTKSVAEDSLPSSFLYKHAMENTSTHGKSKFSTKTAEGRDVSSVEELAMTNYLEKGIYTEGGHWEGRIVNAIFHILFWDIIYWPKKRIVGLYLSKYQSVPNDMYSRQFYYNRKDEIEERLREIENQTIGILIEKMAVVLNDRTEAERSGLKISKSETDIVMRTCVCLGPKKLAAICARLARDYTRWRSGFPDLTLMNCGDKKIIFVEVKSENDKASIKQVQWMQFLLENGISTELFYVGTKNKKKKQA